MTYQVKNNLNGKIYNFENLEKALWLFQEIRHYDLPKHKLINKGDFRQAIKGMNEKQVDLTLEQNILQKISEDTEKAIVRMKRVLSDKIKLKDIDKSMAKTLLDFETEKDELKISILKKEIENFHSGSKRAFFILNRLKLLNDMKIKTTIGSKTLFETIDYEEVPISRIISFIYKEWSEDFSNLIEL